MTPERVIPAALYGIIVVLTLLGGIFGPRIVLLVAAGLGTLLVVIVVGGRREN